MKVWRYLSFVLLGGIVGVFVSLLIKWDRLSTSH